MKLLKSRVLWIGIALLLILAVVPIVWRTQLQTTLPDKHVQLLRRLAAVNDPELATVLDQSVIFIPAGEFIRGSDTGDIHEMPQQSIYLDAFAIDRYEVTNIQYGRFLAATDRRAPSHWIQGIYPDDQADRPVVGISWKDAHDYCAWAGKRLPTEAEWEKACRGPHGNQYSWGDRWNAQRANTDSTALSFSPTVQAGSPTAWAYAWELLQVTPSVGQLGLQPVGSYPDGASFYGVMDLIGNASEWVFDWYNWGDYSNMPAQNPVNLEPQWNHCVRGSAWYDPAGDVNLVPVLSRCSARSSAHAIADPRIGFRCAQSDPEEE